jgi:predicted lactoylglutathione lyase
MSSPKLLLHIGTPKTGTTAVQRFLFDNYDALLGNGVLYPKSVTHNETVHYPINWAIEEGDDEVRGKLIKEIEQANPEFVIISTEMFTTPRFHSNLALAKTVEFFKNCGFKINEAKVVVYLRRQDLFCESIYNEMVKNHSWSRHIQDTSAFLDYFYLLKMWSQFFKKNRIVVRVYEKGQLKNDLFEDFFDAIGLPFKPDYRKPKVDPNPKLSAEMLEFMRITNAIRMLPLEREQFKNELTPIAEQIFSTKGNKSVKTLLDDERANILSMYEKVNEAVAKEFMGREDGRLFCESVDGELPFNQDILVSKNHMAHIIIELWRRLHKCAENSI